MESTTCQGDVRPIILRTARTTQSSFAVTIKTACLCPCFNRKWGGQRAACGDTDLAGAVEACSTVDLPRSCCRPTIGTVGTVARRIIYIQRCAVSKMPYTFIVAVPHPRLVLLARRDRAIPVQEIYNCIGRVRKRRYAHPEIDRARGRSISLDLMIKLVGSR